VIGRVPITHLVGPYGRKPAKKPDNGQDTANQRVAIHNPLPFLVRRNVSMRGLCKFSLLGCEILAKNFCIASNGIKAVFDRVGQMVLPRNGLIFRLSHP